MNLLRNAVELMQSIKGFTFLSKDKELETICAALIELDAVINSEFELAEQELKFESTQGLSINLKARTVAFEDGWMFSFGDLDIKSKKRAYYLIRPPKNMDTHSSNSKEFMAASEYYRNIAETLYSNAVNRHKKFHLLQRLKYIIEGNPPG